MKNTLLLTLAALLLIPSAASAATATADIERRGGTNFGPVKFKAARGEMNDVTVTQANGRLRFHDSNNAVTARGDCAQVNAQTASCPVTEDVAKVKLGNLDDRAKVMGLVGVFGGSGPDVLGGSPGFDALDGQGGSDVLRGKGGTDDLTGGAGSDRLFGGRGGDDLIDGERDGQAAADRIAGGGGRDDVDYSDRDRSLRVNLGRATADRSSGRDGLRRVEGVVGGSGDDRLTGNSRPNSLEGNAGDDRLRGRGDGDTLNGDGGNDTVKGGSGDDIITGGGGTDSFVGGTGDDDFIANDGNAESVDCGTGLDDVRTERLDTLFACDVANSDPLFVQVQPAISGDTATFQVACQQLDGCSGTLTLLGPNGEDFGSGTFADLPDDPRTFSPVTVDLTEAAVTALAQGVVVQVTHGDTGGYRAFMQS